MTAKAPLAVILLAGVSCGGSSLGGSGGSGGSAGTSAGGTGGVAGTSAGGTGGAAGTSGGGTGGVAGTSAGGTGGYPNPEANVPRCLADLVAPCTCKAASECGPQSCFAPGVTRTTTMPDGGACNLTGEADETRVFKPDGSLCYSVQISSRPDMACEVLSIVWRDAAGQEVASAYGYPSFGTCATLTPTVKCKATSETGVAPLTWPAADCPKNACP